jgi:hypothetical protein
MRQIKDPVPKNAIAMKNASISENLVLLKYEQ